MDRVRVGAILGILTCACAANLLAQPEAGVPPTTLSVYQSLSAEALGEAFTGLQAPESLKVAVTVEPVGAYWFVEGALMRELRQRGLQLVPAGERWTLTCAVKEAQVRYTDVRRDGLLGSRVVNRTVSLALWLRVSDRDQAQYLVDRELQLQRTDTIDVSDVSRVEHPEVAATRGVVPSEGFFSSWLEPLIMVGAVGVAIFLLFTTRS